MQDGGLYLLDTCQKIRFERLKEHIPTPGDWTTHQPFGVDQNIAVIADQYAEQSHKVVTSDISGDSFLAEQLPEVSFELEPTRSVPLRRIQTHTCTAMEQGLPRRRFRLFGYQSDLECDREMTEHPIMQPARQRFSQS